MHIALQYNCFKLLLQCGPVDVHGMERICGIFTLCWFRGGGLPEPHMVFAGKKISGAELVHLLLVVPSQLFSAAFGTLLKEII